MGRHRLSGPYGTNLFSRVVAHGEYEIHAWCTGSRKFIPGFRAKTADVEMKIRQEINCVGMDLPSWLTSRAKSAELAFA